MRKLKYWVRKLSKNGEYVDTHHRYLVVNVDEPYAEQVYNLIRDAEKAKGSWDLPNSFELYRSYKSQEE